MVAAAIVVALVLVALAAGCVAWVVFGEPVAAAGFPMKPGQVW